MISHRGRVSLLLQYNPSSLQASPRLPVAPGERELYSGAPGFMWGNQKQQVMETAGPVGWLWPGVSGRVVSAPSGSHCHFLFLYPFTLFLPTFSPSLPSYIAPAFLPDSLPPIGNRWAAQSLRWPYFALPIIKATHLTYIFTYLGLKYAF